MSGGDVNQLHEGRRIQGSMKAQIAVPGHLSTGSSGKTHDAEPSLAARADRPQDVRRRSRSQDPDYAVPALAELENLPREYPVIAVIVADRGEACSRSPS